jgi:hypothetical protein
MITNIENFQLKGMHGVVWNNLLHMSIFQGCRVCNIAFPFLRGAVLYLKTHHLVSHASKHENEKKVLFMK